MHVVDTLGAPLSSFTCGSSGVCTGTTSSTQAAFGALQREINRVGVGYGITRISVDNKLGPGTLTAMVNLAKAIHRKHGVNTDPDIEQVIFGYGDGAPTSTRDLALSAERLTAALARDGVKAQTWSVLQTIKDMAQQVVTSGGVQPAVPPISTSTPVNPYPTTVVVAPTAQTPTAPTPPWGYPATASRFPIPTWALVLAGALIVVGGGVAVAVGVRRTQRAQLHGGRRRSTDDVDDDNLTFMQRFRRKHRGVQSYVEGKWTPFRVGERLTTMIVETPAGTWQAKVHKDGWWSVRGPDPDNESHYGDGDVTADTDRELVTIAKKQARAFLKARLGSA